MNNNTQYKVSIKTLKNNPNVVFEARFYYLETTYFVWCDAQQELLFTKQLNVFDTLTTWNKFPIDAFNCLNYHIRSFTPKHDVKYQKPQKSNSQRILESDDVWIGRNGFFYKNIDGELWFSRYNLDTTWEKISTCQKHYIDLADSNYIKVHSKKEKNKVKQKQLYKVSIATLYQNPDVIFIDNDGYLFMYVSQNDKIYYNRIKRTKCADLINDKTWILMNEKECAVHMRRMTSLKKYIQKTSVKRMYDEIHKIPSPVGCGHSSNGMINHFSRTRFITSVDVSQVTLPELQEEIDCLEFLKKVRIVWEKYHDKT